MTAAATANGRFPADCRRAASLYLERGVLPIPLHPRDKKPIGKAWEPHRHDLR